MEVRVTGTQELRTHGAVADTVAEESSKLAVVERVEEGDEEEGVELKRLWELLCKVPRGL